MLIYEVNLSVNQEIFKAYCDWLRPHMQEVCCLGGFTKACLYELEELDKADPTRKLVVHYHASSKEALQRYLAEQAPRLKAQARGLFGGKFEATRRILLETRNS